MGSKSGTREEPSILAAAERQMRTWVQTAEMGERAAGQYDVRRLAERIKPYLTISREEGTGASEVAQRVGKELGWEVLDKNLLDRVAERFHLSRAFLELVDETRNCWVHDVLGPWMDHKVVPTEKYVVGIECVVLAAACHASVVLVGRGTQFFLPRDRGLAVRLVARKKYRIGQIMQQERLSEEEAGRFVELADQGRREFVERHFHHDISDPHLYDLVINVERLGVEGAARQIITALSR